MDVEDRITIPTPEGVALELTLAGAGSRFIAGALDTMLQILLVALTAVATAAAFGGLNGIGVVILSTTGFAAWYLYDVLFEVLAAGRTPGKRLTHLRVVRSDAQPVDLPASAIRNLVRTAEGPPLLYVPAMLSIFLTRRNQRLGDLAAATLVIRDVARPSERVKQAPIVGRSANPAQAGTTWDVSAITAPELAAVRRFLERRGTLDTRARRDLAHRLEQALRRKTAGAPQTPDAEVFLERLAEEKAGR